MKDIILKVYYIFLGVKRIFIKVYNRIIYSVITPPLVRTTDETLNRMINSRCSVSRYGDGEFALMEGKGLLFQPFSIELSERLKEIIKSEQKNHIVCIPYVLQNIDWCTDRSKSYWIKYLDSYRSKIYKMIDKHKEYYDAQVSRLYIDHKDKSTACDRFNKFKQIWDKREVVIVEVQKVGWE